MRNSEFCQKIKDQCPNCHKIIGKLIPKYQWTLRTILKVKDKINWHNEFRTFPWMNSGISSVEYKYNIV